MARNLRKTPGKTDLIEKDPIEVFCRIKPVPDELKCVKVLDSKTVALAHPDSLTCNQVITNHIGKEIHYVFEQVFDESCRQKNVFDRVALPLVKGLIKGHNGLLITYGVTGSGKTFTMNGVPENGGILPRSLDVIFNSISMVQARKFVFKPDRLNGFDVQSDADAMMEAKKELIQSQRTPKTPRKVPSDPNLAERVREIDKVEEVDDHSLYAVFVSHVEIYNNHIYDLLDDLSMEAGRYKQPQSKILREDSNHNMFVHGVNEVEVTSTEEAFEVFYRGQKRKRMAHTCLNAESSRSHSVFTLRLVQAPLHSSGDEVLQEKNVICISQLSMVDLAGSERTNRTKNSGQRLREAGNINNSLLTLRSCFEVLRENQANGTNKVVPYRQSRLTHLFKNYFDGEGKVKMIVCVNPKVEDYDETIHVLKFADISQKLQVPRPTTMRYHDMCGVTPSRRLNFNHVGENGNGAGDMALEVGVLYSLGPEFPPLQLTSPDNPDIIKNLISFLEMRHEKREGLRKEQHIKQQNFRIRLVEIEKQNTLAKQEILCLKATLDAERKNNCSLENKIENLESLCGRFEWKVQQRSNEILALKSELDEVRAGLSQQVLDKEKEKQKIKQKLVTEKQRAEKEIQQKRKQLAAEFRSKMWVKDEKLRRVKEIIASDCESLKPPPSLTPSSSEGDLQTTATNKPSNPVVPPISWALPADSVRVTRAVSAKKDDEPNNSRRRRSRSATTTDCVWLDHRPITSPLPLSTVLQPKMRRKKSVTNLTDPKDLTNSKTNMYCLTTQGADSGGELETKLYKGDVLPTTGGGAQVVFNDVETLRQSSPSRLRSKRKSDEDVGRINDDGASNDHVSVDSQGKRRKV